MREPVVTGTLRRGARGGSKGAGASGPDAPRHLPGAHSLDLMVSAPGIADRTRTGPCAARGPGGTTRRAARTARTPSSRATAHDPRTRPAGRSPACAPRGRRKLHGRRQLEGRPSLLRDCSPGRAGEGAQAGVEGRGPDRAPPDPGGARGPVVPLRRRQAWRATASKRLRLWTASGSRWRA